MKVILADDVRGLGHRGDTVTVKDGFARNYLFPQGFAYEASVANTRRLGEEKRKYDEKTLRDKDVAQLVARKVEGLSIILHKKAGEEDVLYGSVTPSDIADALAQRGIEVDRRKIELAEPIKRLGRHVVHVRFHRDVISELTIDVQPIATITQ
jgi:large subunit ribosomal protein L9